MAVDEVLASFVSYYKPLGETEKLEKLAKELQLSSRLAESIEAWHGTDIAADTQDRVRGSIRRALTAPSPEILRDLAQVRIFVETAMAWKAIGVGNGGDLLNALIHANDNMREIVESGDFSDEKACSIWGFDGDFHRQLCQYSGLMALTSIVDVILEECKEIGRSHSVSEARATLDEHDAVINSVQDGDETEILNSIRGHVYNLCNRWASRGRNLSEPLELRELLSTERNAAFEESEQCFFDSLASLVGRHSGRWVLISRSEIVCVKRSKAAARKVADSKSLKFGEYTLRLITPDLLQESYQFAE